MPLDTITINQDVSLIPDPTPRRFPMTRRAFTLIELLVVIAIIAVLIALLAAGRAGGPRGRPARQCPTTSSRSAWPCTTTITPIDVFPPGYVSSVDRTVLDACDQDAENQHGVDLGHGLGVGEHDPALDGAAAALQLDQLQPVGGLPRRTTRAA